MVAGAGNESEANTFVNCGRHGDTLAAGVFDIRIVSGNDTVLINTFTDAGDSPSYSFNDKRVVIIGIIAGTIAGKGNTLWLGSQLGGIQFPGTLNGALLNYYDEGTTALTLGTTGTQPTVPVTANASWTRIGRRVSLSVVFAEADLTGSTGNLQITGIPFVCGSIPAVGSVALLGLGTVVAAGILGGGGTTLSLLSAINIGVGIPTVSASGKYVYASISYDV
jgi:hypothetical protein